MSLTVPISELKQRTGKILRSGVLGEADYVVSGDKALLALTEFGGAEIVRPARFLEILSEQES